MPCCLCNVMCTIDVLNRIDFHLNEVEHIHNHPPVMHGVPQTCPHTKHILSYL